MYSLLAIEAHALTVPTFVQQEFLVCFGLEGRADEVDGGRQVVGSCSGGDHAAGVEELGQVGRAGEGKVEGEVFGGEDEAGEEGGRCGADGGEGGEGLGRFNKGEDRDGGFVGAGPGVGDHVGDEGEVRGRLSLGEHDGGQVGGFEELGQVVEGKTRADAVDAHDALFDGGRDGLVELGAHESTGFSFAPGRDAVFEVIGDTVGGQGAGFVEVAL